MGSAPKRPVIVVGEFNLNDSFVTHEGNTASRTMLRDNIWKWIQQENWIDTNWAERRITRSSLAQIEKQLVANAFYELIDFKSGLQGTPVELFARPFSQWPIQFAVNLLSQPSGLVRGAPTQDTSVGTL